MDLAVLEGMQGYAVVFTVCDVGSGLIRELSMHSNRKEAEAEKERIEREGE